MFDLSISFSYSELTNLEILDVLEQHGKTTKNLRPPDLRGREAMRLLRRYPGAPGYGGPKPRRDGTGPPKALRQ